MTPTGGGTMRLFGRKEADEGPRCPDCRELVVPADSLHCLMCGHDLRADRVAARFTREREAEAEESRQA
jgi:hypothetical protein